MSALRNYLNKVKPHFEPDGKLHAFRSVFDGFETFLYVPNTTARTGVNIHDAIDSKRIMSMVVIALLPALLFGMYNVGYQNYLAAGTLATASFLEVFVYGALVVLPKILVSYIVGLGIEFAWAQWKGEEIQEGYLVSGILIPLIIPVGCPLWMLALACAFAVIFCKEIFGGTGMNLFNPAISARMFLFFAYPSKMTGDQVWIARDSIFGLGNTLPDTFTAATPLGQIGQGVTPDASLLDMALDFIPGNICCRHRYWCGNPTVGWYRFMENHGECVCRRWPDGITLPVARHDPDDVVRTVPVGWFRLWCCLHGHRPCHLMSY